MKELYNHIIVFDKEKGLDLIKENYILTCGLNKEKNALKKIYGHAMDCLEKVLETISIKAVVSSFSPEHIGDGEIIINDNYFSCPELNREMSGDIISIITFGITAGKISYDMKRVLDQAYSDIGGTAVVDAGRDFLRIWLNNFYKAEKGIVSQAFGPGFYGMPASDVTKIFKFLDCDSIGIELLTSGFMIPVKSCVGFFIISRKEESLPVLDCFHCLGKGKMCNYCKAGRNVKIMR